MSARVVTPDRPPDLTLRRQDGTVYMHRWHLVPRNERQNIYLHQFLGDDDDRALHDHPYDNMSLVLDTGYDELTPGGLFRRSPGEVVKRSATDPHRVILLREGDLVLPSWSLFVTGPRVRDWGFHFPDGWVSHEVVLRGKYTGFGDQRKS